MGEKFEFKAKYERIIDGDSLEVVLDRGFRDSSIMAFRLLGVDTPELRSQNPLEREAARLVTTDVYDWLTADWNEEWPLKIIVFKRSKYGDYLIRVKRPSGGVDDDLGIYLLDRGLARIYLGDKKKPWLDPDLTRIITSLS